jgi:hypothetical protein
VVLCADGGLFAFTTTRVIKVVKIKAKNPRVATYAINPVLSVLLRLWRRRFLKNS